MVNTIDGICRYNNIVHISCILLIICGFVQSDHDETAKTHVGEFKKMNKRWNLLFLFGLAIVGGGIGGISTAYWLKYYLNDSVAITIYESKEVC